MSDSSAPATTRNRKTVGLVLIMLGLVLTLDSAGLLRTEGLGRWWPLLLIGIGLVKAKQPREDGQRAAGVAFLMLGSLFLLTSILAVTSWTLLLIASGVFLLWQGIEGSPAAGVVVSESPYLSDMALIGYVRRSHLSDSFRGGSVTAVMSGVEIDLRKASLASGSAAIDVVAFWGGIEIKVPAGWAVDGRVVAVMGAFENKVDSPVTAGAPRLVVRGHAIMGAVVIAS
jgi:hypothetical protein